MSVKVSFVGRLGKDAEFQNSPNNNQFISFHVGTSDNVKKGEDNTTWMSVSADYNRFKNMYPYLKKGCLVQVTGTERCVLYTNNKGISCISRNVSSDSIEFIRTANSNSNTNNNNNQQFATNTSGESIVNAQMNNVNVGNEFQAIPQYNTPEPAYAMAAPTAQVSDDDLPF
jgi:single stranded DNA-binding protein